MSYDLKTSLLPISHRLRPGGSYTKTSITIHSTANLSSTPQGERNWLNNTTNKRLAAWHYCIGAGVVIQAIPENEEAWHCGQPDGNKHSIGIEIVESGDRHQVLITAVEFTAKLLKNYGWGIDKLKKHYDWTGKNCPRILIDPLSIKGSMDWDWFVKMVSEKLDNDITEQSKMIVDGVEIPFTRILYKGNNFAKLRDLADIFGYEISNKGSIAVLTKK